MLNIAICDDDMENALQIERMLEKIETEKGIRKETEVFSDGETLWQAIENGERYDLIYLDIEMEHIDGVTAAKRIRQKDRDVLLIFVSGYDTYCKVILEVEPFRFLDKPIDPEKFKEYFLKASDRILDSRRCFTFQNHGAYQRIPYRDILYFESNRRIIILHTEQKDYSFYAKMNEVEQQVQENNRFFIRVHRSYLVNYLHIELFEKHTTKLSSGEVVPISIDMKSNARRRYLSLLEEE